MGAQPYYDPSQYLKPDPTVDTSNVPTPLGGTLNTFAADTFGVVYRAFSGSVDPWTKAELIDEATANYIRAGMDPSTAQAQAAGDITHTVDTSTVTWSDAAWDVIKSLFTGGDPTKPCGITNIGACFPSWLVWVIAGVGILVVLAILGPYVGLADDLVKK